MPLTHGPMAEVPVGQTKIYLRRDRPVQKRAQLKRDVNQKSVMSKKA